MQREEESPQEPILGYCKDQLPVLCDIEGTTATSTFMHNNAPIHSAAAVQESPDDHRTDDGAKPSPTALVMKFVSIVFARMMMTVVLVGGCCWALPCILSPACLANVT